MTVMLAQMDSATSESSSHLPLGQIFRYQSSAHRPKSQQARLKTTLC